jgi:hypothetical protein
MNKIIMFLSEKVFRFRYQDPHTDTNVWDVGIYEDNIDKMFRDVFIIGISVGVVITALCVVVWWLL